MLTGEPVVFPRADKKPKQTTLTLCASESIEFSWLVVCCGVFKSFSAGLRKQLCCGGATARAPADGSKDQGAGSGSGQKARTLTSGFVSLFARSFVLLPTAASAHIANASASLPGRRKSLTWSRH